VIVAEVGNFGRFNSRRQLMAYLGLIPSEHSSSATIRRGAITKTGNTLARTCLVEAAWTYRFPARVTQIIRNRLQSLPEPIRSVAWKTQVRLSARYRKLAAAGKPAPKWSRQSRENWSASSGQLPEWSSRNSPDREADIGLGKQIGDATTLKTIFGAQCGRQDGEGWGTLDRGLEQAPVANARPLDRGSPATNLGYAVPTADKSQINRRPCFLSFALGIDTTKYYPQNGLHSLALILTQRT
jgi:hypothetical protein